MSVTFFITNSPEKVSESECLCVYDGEADSSCCWCDGTGMSEDREPAWPWTNMANVNARAVLLSIGVVCGEELYGAWEGETIDRAISGCLRALNSEARRSVAVRDEEYVEGGRAGVRVVHEGNVARVERMGASAVIHGYSDEVVCLRVRELLTICRKAKTEGERVVFG